VAYGMIAGFREAGLKVPEDVAIIGFGDQADQNVLQTDLTTIKQPAREKGQQAAKMVLGQLNNPKKKNSFKLKKPELVIRKSCGC
jgi:LacI family transcriptional regulator